jgi:hypothetical protein
MSDTSKMREQLEGIKDAYVSDSSKIRNETLAEGFEKLKSRIKGVDVPLPKTEVKEQKTAERKFTPLQIAEKATATYKEKIRPEVETSEVRTSEKPVTHAVRTNAKAMAKALTNMRTSGNAGKPTQSTPNGNGDLGQYTSPANNNDGDLGNNTGFGQYAALTTSMTLEEYQDYFAKKFVKEEETYEPLEEQEVIESTDVVKELEERLLELDDTAWKSIDVVMRELAKEENITPKDLHKAFKSEHGLIPDEWLKENRITEACGFMPLDEATRIIKNGCVYDVTCMWRGGTHRLKFFWPEEGTPSKEDMQNAVEMFYPKARLIAHYPCTDEPDNFMVVVPPVTENFLFIPQDNWLELDEEVSDYIQSIYEEEGEPLAAPTEVENGILLKVEDHVTGEEKEIFIEKKGLWDNIHAKRKRGESPAKKGDKDYPKTLNVEETEQDGPEPTPRQRRGAINNARRQLNLAKHDDDKNAEKLQKARLKAFGVNEGLEQAKKNVGADSCWDGYKAKGTKKKDGKEVPNCVKEGDEMKGMSQKSGDKRSTDSGAGMTAKGVAKYNARTGGNLKTAVTTPPSELKAGSKAAGRRKSFCARSKGWNGERGKAARSRWNC